MDRIEASRIARVSDYVKQDAKLSLAAFGLYCRLVFLPRTGIKIKAGSYLEFLASLCADEIDKVADALSELEASRYVIIERLSDFTRVEVPDWDNPLENPLLSLGAKGLYKFLRVKHDEGQVFSREEICASGPDKPEDTISYLNELAEQGFVYEDYDGAKKVVRVTPLEGDEN